MVNKLLDTNEYECEYKNLLGLLNEKLEKHKLLRKLNNRMLLFKLMLNKKIKKPKSI
jgi:hypothetical protein